MTRFTGNSFKITPVCIEGKNNNEEKIDFISELMNKRIFDISTIPNAGWVAFQASKNRESIDSKIPIETTALGNNTEMLSATGIVDRLDNKLKKSLTPSLYSQLPQNNKYFQVPTDFLFYNNNDKLFCLISSTNSKSVDIADKEFLNNFPFTDYGYTINRNPSEFNIPSDLILWMLYLYYEKEGKINSNYIISDVELLNGRLKVPVSLQYSGRSTPEHLMELKYSIAKRRMFTKVEFMAKANEDIFQFSMDTTGCVEFHPSLCEYNVDDDNVSKNNLAKAINIYVSLIPALKGAYHSDSTWPSSEREKFISKCATDCKNDL